MVIKEILNQWKLAIESKYPAFEKIAVLTNEIPSKIKFFSLDAQELEKQFHHQLLLDSSLNIGLEKEPIKRMEPNELMQYARKLEDKYGSEITQLKYLRSVIKPAPKLLETIGMALAMLKKMENQEQLFAWLENPLPDYNMPDVLVEIIRQLDQLAPIQNPSEKVLAGWLLRFSVLNQMPAFASYVSLAAWAHHLCNQKQGIDGGGLLFFAKAILPHQATYLRIIEQLKYKDGKDFLNSDPSGLMLIIQDAQSDAYKATEKRLATIYHQQVEFEDLAPKQRNMVNYFFYVAYKFEKTKNNALNPRQQEIMDLLHSRGFISTKDLSLQFRCNRKTIQRDFQDLLQMGLVRQMGQGAALRYTLPIYTCPNAGLEKLQNVNLQQTQAVQMSLFAPDMPKEKPEAIASGQ